MNRNPHAMAAIESKMRRLAGASPEAKGRMNRANVKADDWMGVCRRCKATIRGTLLDFQAHQEECVGK